MGENVKKSQPSEQEIAERRDDVVRRMIATPPTQHVKNTNNGKRGRPIAS